MKVEVIRLDSQVETLLAESGLPVSDLRDHTALTLLGVRQNGRLVGVVGIERYGTHGLLRSLAVVPMSRSKGLGLTLVAELETWAVKHGISTLYLLTTTAAEFFARLGYETVARAEAPALIAATAEFKDLCPASSAFMRKSLTSQHGDRQA